jgi:two-component system, OmpR family, KDP operon response regulator KdpE
MTEALVVCPDAAERRTLVAILKYGRITASTARSTTHATNLLRRRAIDVVLLGAASHPEPVAFVRELRARTDRPMIAVSASLDELTAVAMLDAGADDIVRDPVGVEELLARVRASIRRCIRDEDQQPIVTDDFTMYLADRRLVLADGTEVLLSPTEWRLIEVLAARAGHLVSRHDVLTAVWGPQRAHKTQYLRVYMAGIRRKIEPEPASPRYFVTVPGLGLRFETQPATAEQPAS